jgi:hypothetical protein
MKQRQHHDRQETRGKASGRRGLGAALILAAAAALAIATPMAASAAPSAGAAPAAPSGSPPCNISGQQVASAGHGHHLSGIIIAGGLSTNTGGCHKPPPEPAFNGTPPLLFHGNPPTCFFAPCENGNVMMTAQTGPLVVTPIFWDPTGSMSASYKSIIASFIADVAKDSGHNKNVFSVADQYFGNNGQIRYNIQAGPVITATNAMPPSGCTVAPGDTSGIYADNSGYSSCLDDAQLQAEVDSVSAAHNLPHNLSHIFVLYLPKHVESCFNPGSSTSTAGGQFCTINHQPTAAYCAYHSEDPASAVYANMPFPIYASPVGFTCGTDARFPVNESPNGNVDADVEISPSSHEMNEAITDPDTETGWYDSTGNENGDDCAYIFGRTRGAPGAFFNQVINGGKFIIQEEFSNNLFASSGGTAGCLQSA